MDGRQGADGVSWWIGLDRQAFYRALAAEQERIQALGINPLAADIAVHRRTRKQLAKDQEGKD